VPMVRITLAIPEDLRFRLKLALMSLRRKRQSRMTQDEFCARAIAAQLDFEENREGAKARESQLAVFLGTCVKEGGLTKATSPMPSSSLKVISRAWRSRPGECSSSSELFSTPQS